MLIWLMGTFHNNSQIHADGEIMWYVSLIKYKNPAQHLWITMLANCTAMYTSKGNLTLSKIRNENTPLMVFFKIINDSH